jgi:hypothetical protein
MWDSLTNLLSTPVPHLSISPTALYAMDCIGGAVIFLGALFVIVHAIRDGIDGGKHVARILREHRFWREVGEDLIGHWRPLGDTEPIRPATPTIWDTWQSL